LQKPATIVGPDDETARKIVADWSERNPKCTSAVMLDFVSKLIRREMTCFASGTSVALVD